MFPTSATSLGGRTRVNPSSAGERESRRAASEHLAQQRTQQRTRQAQVFVASPSPRHCAIGSHAHIIVARHRVRRNIARIEIALDATERALGRQSVATASSGLNADEIARGQLKALLL